MRLRHVGEIATHLPRVKPWKASRSRALDDSADWPPETCEACARSAQAETGQVALAADAKQPDSAESLAPAPAETIGSTRSLRRSFASDVNGRRAAGVDCPLKAASRDIEAVLHIEQVLQPASRLHRGCSSHQQ